MYVQFQVMSKNIEAKKLQICLMKYMEAWKARDWKPGSKEPR